MNIEVQFERAKENMLWVQSRLDGFKLPGMPSSKRQALAAGCFHIALEHNQAIIVLVDDKLFGSALALIRVVSEAYLKGLWLLHVASEGQLDDAGEDQSPGAVQMMTDLAQKQFPLTWLRNSWGRLCSYTHTGYHQIGARLTTEGLTSNYQELAILDALNRANNVVLCTMIEFAQLGDSQALAREALNRLKTLNQTEPVEGERLTVPPCLS